MTTGNDHVLARDLAAAAGERLLGLRAQGGAPDLLRKAGDRLSHEFLTAELAARRPGDVVLSEEGADDPARLAARRVWIVDPLDGTREFGEPGRTDWAVHVALWERSEASGSGDLAAGAVALPARGRILSTVPGALSGGAGRDEETGGAGGATGTRGDGGGKGADRGEPDACTTPRSEYFRSY